MSNLREILEYCEELRRDFSDPPSYLERDYYIRSAAKVEVLDEVISEIKSFLEED